MIRISYIIVAIFALTIAARAQDEAKPVPDGTIAYYIPGKQRFHAEGCPRLKASREAKADIQQMSYRQGVLGGLQYCSRCPKDAPQVEVDIPDPADREVFLAYPEGPDSFARIQAAIDEVGDMEPAANGFRGGAVLLKKGAYYLTGGLHLPAGVVLRGEGDSEDGTVLVFHNPKGTGITLGRKKGSEPVQPAVETPAPAPPFKTRIADAYVPVGSIAVTVKDAGPFNVGTYVNVIKTTNNAWINTLGMADPGSGGRNNRKSKAWTPVAYRLHHVRRITKVEGNRLTFEAPLPQGFVAEHGGGEIEEHRNSPLPSHIGVEGLRIVSNYDRFVNSNMRGGADGYEADEENNMASGISFYECVHAWARNCTVLHTWRNSFTNKNSRDLTVRDCKSLEPISVIRGGMRYSFSNSDSSSVLFYRCYAEGGRHPYVTGSRDPGPIAFVKSKTLGGGSETHQRWATGVLFDCIEVLEKGGISAGNRGAGGSSHGWAGANVVMWNCTSPAIKVENPPTPEQNLAIGCILTGEATEASGDGFVESTGTHVKPDSLFVQQLIDRIGKEKVMAVLE